EVERVLVQLGSALEMKAELQLARTRVVPGLEVRLGMAVMELEQATVTPAGLASAQLGRERRLDPFAQAGKEVMGS
ncbi:MAG: hypothetical protein QOI23_2430, partial [Chloroflexota bacterium]|nr:hypothetical protein [Chloroflexota bacterium]